MEMVYYPVGRSSYDDYFQLLEADIQHANALATAVPRGKDGACLRMKLVYNNLAPLLLFMLQWTDSCTCLLPRHLNLFEILLYKVYTDGRHAVSTCGRRATVDDFYAFILPSLLGLHNNLVETEITRDEKPGTEIISKERLHGGTSSSKVDFEREAVCGICLEPCQKIVLPNCCHGMCINCYRDWNMRSEACPFCRDNIK